jgi:hypothetical protein
LYEVYQGLDFENWKLKRLVSDLKKDLSKCLDHHLVFVVDDLVDFIKQVAHHFSVLVIHRHVFKVCGVEVGLSLDGQLETFISRVIVPWWLSLCSFTS